MENQSLYVYIYFFFPWPISRNLEIVYFYGLVSIAMLKNQRVKVVEYCSMHFKRCVGICGRKFSNFDCESVGRTSQIGLDEAIECLMLGVFGAWETRFRTKKVIA